MVSLNTAAIAADVDHRIVAEALLLIGYTAPTLTDIHTYKYNHLIRSIEKDSLVCSLFVST